MNNTELAAASSDVASSLCEDSSAHSADATPPHSAGTTPAHSADATTLARSAGATLSFVVPREDLAEFGALPDNVRADVALKLRLFERIHARAKAKAQSVQAGCNDAAARLMNRPGFSGKRLRTIYYAFLAEGDWRTLANKAKAPELSEREGRSQLPLEFRRWWGEFSMTNQRQKVSERIRALMERLRMWRVTGRKEFVIPGYDGPPADAAGTDHPAGWHASNLYRFAADAFEKAAFAIGRQEARNFAPQVNTSRAKLRVGQHIAFDDQVHDIKVNFERNRIIQRPLEFVCLDRFSGCFLGHYFKPVIWNEAEGTRNTLNQEDFVWFAVSWLLSTGYREDTGTTVFAEHGTAKFPDWLKEAIQRVTGDKIQFVEGGVDRRAAFDGMYPGPARGNFRVKSWLESIFNLVRNEMADLSQFPGQVGKDRLHAPEEEQAASGAIEEGKQSGLVTRQRMNEQLALAEIALARKDDIVLMRRPYLDWGTFVQLAMRAYDRIDNRTQHKLQGWEEAGLMTQEYRLEIRPEEPEGGWLPIERLMAMPDDQRLAVQAYLEADAINRIRPRRMSPLEVKQLQAHELTRLEPAIISQLLPPRPPFATEREVNQSGLFVFEDANIRPGKLRFHAIAHLGGRDYPKRSGEKFMTMINPVRPNALYLFDASGRYKGACPEWDTIDAADTAAIHRQQGKVERELVRKLAPVARAGAKLAEKRATDTQHNAGVIGKRKQEQENLASLASDAFRAEAEVRPAERNNQPTEE